MLSPLYHTDDDGALYTYRGVFDEYTEAFGIIKCGYVQLFDNQGRKVYSMQAATAAGPVCRASYAGHDMGDLVPVTLTDAGAAALEAWAAGCAKHGPAWQYASANARGGIFYVKPNALAWGGVPGAERTITQPKASLVPWIVAAVSFLL